MNNIIGIDLGTTNSVVSIFENDRVAIIPNKMGNKTTPSNVCFTDDGRFIGNIDSNKIIQNHKNTIYNVKRFMGLYQNEYLEKEIDLLPYKVEFGEDKRPYFVVNYQGKEEKYLPEQISSMILEKMKEIAQDYLGNDRPITQAVITVPAYFSDSQRNSTIEAGKIAGLNVLRIINEPTAAAMAYGFDKIEKNNEKNILVFDLGGGTLDVTILNINNNNFEIKSTYGDTKLGGIDFDKRLLNYCIEKFLETEEIDLNDNPKALRKLMITCENSKKSLSVEDSVSIEVYGISNGLDLEIDILRIEFEDLCEDLFNKCLNCVEIALNNSGLKKDEINNIILVGGSTKIPKIQDLLKNYFNKELNQQLNKDEAIAEGAAIQAAILNNNLEDIVLSDVNPWSLGIEIEGGLMKKIITKNSTIPIKKSKIFTTVEDNQKQVYIKIYEGEWNIAIENNELGCFYLKNIAPKPRGIPQIEVIFELLENGTLKVKCLDLNNTENFEHKEVKNIKRLTNSQIEEMIKKSDLLLEQDELNKNRILRLNELKGLLIDYQRDIKNIKNISKNDFKKFNEEINILNIYIKNNKYDSLENIDQKIQNLKFIFDLCKN